MQRQLVQWLRKTTSLKTDADLRRLSDQYVVQLDLRQSEYARESALSFTPLSGRRTLSTPSPLKRTSISPTGIRWEVPVVHRYWCGIVQQMHHYFTLGVSRCRDLDGLRRIEFDGRTRRLDESGQQLFLLWVGRLQIAGAQLGSEIYNPPVADPVQHDCGFSGVVVPIGIEISELAVLVQHPSRKRQLRLGTRSHGNVGFESVKREVEVW